MRPSAGVVGSNVYQRRQRLNHALGLLLAAVVAYLCTAAPAAAAAATSSSTNHLGSTRAYQHSGSLGFWTCVWPSGASAAGGYGRGRFGGN